MNDISKTIKYLAIILALMAGAVFFYAAGLGTGLYVARASQIVVVQITATASTLDLAPTATPLPPPPTPVGTSAGTPAATQTPIPLPETTATQLPTPATDGNETERVNFDIFWEAWGLLQGDFYGDLPAESELPYAAIRGVLSSTGDPYTAFLDPMQADITRTDMSGSFEGIGATVRLRPDGQFEIVEPLAGYPAITAGVRAGDIILEVNGIDLAGMNIYEAIALIRGPAGTTVNLRLQREGIDEPFIIEIERARIEMAVVEYEILDGNIAYIRLTEFGETATAKLEEALKAVLADDPAGLILDLRGNPGGYLSVAVEVASQFVGDGPILIERFKDGDERPYSALRGGLALDVPLVVLVNGGSASASEIVAGAIQDTERGVLIGTTTLGKGSVQAVHTLSDGSQLRVTIARWFTPNGRAIHGEGLQPDIEVKISEEDLQAERDPQLERAVEYLLGN
ncbi:MAG: S41 family peptidase [Anaerolineae bacterium]|nr:S41 family peptidase [Anaerolineae bacterium]